MHKKKIILLVWLSCAYNTGNESAPTTTREERQERLAKIALNFEFLYGDKPQSATENSTISSTPIYKPSAKPTHMTLDERLKRRWGEKTYNYHMNKSKEEKQPQLIIKTSASAPKNALTLDERLKRRWGEKDIQLSYQ